MYKQISLLSIGIIILAGCAESRIEHQKVPKNTYRTKASSPQKTTSKKRRHYLVKKGDSLWKIAKKYGITVEGIKAENRGIAIRNLKIGQKIYIPKITRRSGVGFNWPSQGDVINYFGEKLDSTINKGINIALAPSDLDVYASKRGEVIFANNLKGWGHAIILQHPSGYYTIYANLDSPLVKEGVTAKTGQLIARVASGKGGEHVLHFQIRKRTVPQDPLKYLN
tara:strand:+ start:1525 stop:2196 length:672 start_codon:yes stop_codon:yes gene_type:complete